VATCSCIVVLFHYVNSREEVKLVPCTTVIYEIRKCVWIDYVADIIKWLMYEGWNFNSGNYLFTTDTK